MRMTFNLSTLKALLIFSVIGSLSFTENALAMRDIPDDNLAYPALIIIENRHLGSGFYLKKAEHVYFVTARHVLFDPASVSVGKLEKEVEVPKELSHKCVLIRQTDPPGTTRLDFYGSMSNEEKQRMLRMAPNDQSFRKAIEMLFDRSQNPALKGKHATLLSYPRDTNERRVNVFGLPLETLRKGNKISFHKSFDVAAIKIGRAVKEEDKERNIRLSGEIELIKPSKSGFVMLSETYTKLFKDVLVGNPVFVFGYPTSLRIDPYLDIKLPLLRKGVVAGKNESLKVIIIDCPVNYGNSGGLVVEVERIGIGNINYYGIGIVKSFVPAFYPYGAENSGYSIVVPMDAVNSLLSK